MDEYEIILNGIFGWEITYAGIVEQTKLANGRPLGIKIHSDGGSVPESVAIYNELALYQKKNGQITFYITGWAQSAASYLLTLPNAKVVAYRNSTVMIHNPWTWTQGDYRQHRSATSRLEALAESMSGNYAAKTGSDLKLIREQMDDETILIGSALKEAGFADEYIDDLSAEIENSDDTETRMLVAACADKTAFMQLAKKRITTMLSKMAAYETNTNQGETGMSGQTIQNTGAVSAASQPASTPQAVAPAAVQPVASAPIGDENSRAIECMKAQAACPAMANQLQADFIAGKSAEYFSGIVMGFTTGKASSVVSQSAVENPPSIGTGGNEVIQPQAGAGKTYGETGQVARMGRQ